MSETKGFTYQMILHDDDELGHWVGVHEVYYNKDGSIEHFCPGTMAIAVNVEDIELGSPQNQLKWLAEQLLKTTEIPMLKMSELKKET